MENINVGVIGIGYWGKKVVSEYAQLSKGDSNINLLGVCDVFEDNLKFCKDAYDVPYRSRPLQNFCQILTLKPYTFAHQVKHITKYAKKH